MWSAQVASKDATSMGSVHTFRGDRVVCMSVQLNRCCDCVVLFFRVGQYGEVCVLA